MPAPCGCVWNKAMANHIVGLGIGQDEPITRNEGHMRELEAAMSDILHENHFCVPALGDAELNVTIHKEDQRVVLCVQKAGEQAEQPVLQLHLSTKPLRGLMRDYFLICESYLAAIRDHDTRKIEAVDMGRRGIHNEGAEIISEMLKDKVTMDFCTARRLFTLVAILHMK